MRKLLIALSLLFAWQAKAQYFQSTFGGPAFERNSKMIPTLDAAGGYVLVGDHNAGIVGSVNEIYVVRSDNNGATPIAPFFNNSYTLLDPVTLTPWPVVTWSVAEVSPAPGVFEYVVTGTVITNLSSNDYDVFVIKLNSFGFVIWALRYDFIPNFGFKEPQVKIDNANANILIAGRCFDYTNPMNGQDIYALSINAATGGLNWFQSYDIQVAGVSQNDGATDIIDNPYTPGQCLVVGYTNNDALLLTLNSATGGLLAAPLTYTLGGGAMSQQLTSIRVSGNPLIPNAFVVSGTVVFPFGTATQSDAWAMLIDQTGVVSWSTTHDNSLAVGLNNRANEIVERFNGFSGLHEYYTAGTIFPGGPADVHVLKLNNFGLLMAAGEFIYGTAVDNEFGNSICLSNTGGFTAAAQNSVFSGEQMLINSYFNGVNACNFATGTFASVNNTPTTANPNALLFSSPRSQYLVYNCPNMLAQNTICFAVVVGGGSNLKETPVVKKQLPKSDGLNFTVMGSDDQKAGAGNINIEITSGMSGQLSARIVDQLGREYACKLTDEGNGKISLGTNIPSAGMYYIVLSNGKESKSQTLFMK